MDARYGSYWQTVDCLHARTDVEVDADHVHDRQTGHAPEQGGNVGRAGVPNISIRNDVDVGLS